MFVEFCLIFFAIFVYFWYYIEQKQSYFKKLNVKYEKISVYNSVKEIIFRKRNLQDMVEDMYKAYNHRYIFQIRVVLTPAPKSF